MKTTVWLSVSVAVFVVVVVVVILGAKSSQQKCTSSKRTVMHTVIMKDGSLSSPITQAKLCDKLTITNEDSQSMLMAFDINGYHHPYDGVGETLLKQGDSMSITLVKTGEYGFHDHPYEKYRGLFTVTN